MENKRIVMASYPQGWVTPENFRLETLPAQKPADGQVLIKAHWLSLDPYMRGRMSQAKSYAKGVEPGDVMTGEVAGEIVESRHPGFRVGETVTARSGWQLYGCISGAEVTKVDAQRAPLSYYLGCLGMPGLTAYFGMKEIGAPKPGDTVVVSAASGAVGSVVGQLAKAWGCRAVGIAGGKAKCDYVVKELGFDACVDYKAGNLRRDLVEACPKGIDVNFENVGGEILDTLLTLMNPFSRIIVCGMISDYNRTEGYALKNIRAVLVNRIRMQGMIVFDWQKRYPEGVEALSTLVSQGKLKYRESVAQGLENAPAAFIGMLKGENFGKQLVKLI